MNETMSPTEFTRVLTAATPYTVAWTGAAFGAATEIVVPAYAYLPVALLGHPTAYSVSAFSESGWCITFDLYGRSTIVTGAADDAITWRVYAGAVPGTGDEIIATPPALVLPLNAAAQKFHLHLELYSRSAVDNELADVKVGARWVWKYGPAADAVVTATVEGFSIADTNVLTTAGDLYLWLTGAGETGASGTTTFIYPEHLTVTLTGHTR